MEGFVPLASFLRPKRFSDFVGQDHLVGKEGIITKLVKKNTIPSFIFWGPPGSGKTTLAHLIASKLKAHFVSQSAVTSKLEDIRKVVVEAIERQKLYALQTILFIDEIHRFNKAQQDSFLPHVEKGTIVLIGATTENPSFEVIGPLLSRSRVLVFNKLSESELKKIAKNGLNYLKRKIDKKALKFLLFQANGDARILLTTIEVAQSLTRGQFTTEIIKQALQKEHLFYDRQGDEHFNTISAFIKSMRASQPDAALYYLARMIEAGEDPLFIARRMVIFASEDVGMAQPTALVVANEVFRACETIGYPECAINLAHGAVYLSLAKKDRAVYNGLREAQADVKKYGNEPIPLSIRNAPTKLMKNLDYGKGYEAYTKEDLLPKKFRGKKYFKALK